MVCEAVVLIVASTTAEIDDMSAGAVAAAPAPSIDAEPLLLM